MTDGAVLLVDKPAGITSHDVVARVRREHGVDKVGHAGTLDPFATGLLVVLVGREATREQVRFMEQPKTYRVQARFGAISDTGDRDGTITETGVVPGKLELPTGQLRQRTPAYSAVKIRGERAHRRARRGEELEMPDRIVDVHRFELLKREGASADFEIECSSGTYVRALIADLGDAYCEKLRRTHIGPFEAPESERCLVLAKALETLTQAEAERVRRR